MILLDTTNDEAVYQTLSNILEVPKEYIDYFIIRNKIDLTRGSVKDINIPAFYKFISSYSNKDISTNLNFSHITISHLTARLSLESIIEEPLYNLSCALINNTEISRFLNNEGIVFTTEKDKVTVIYNGTKVNWKSYDSPTSQMIINRLEGNNVWPTRDNCINGLLFHGKIHENPFVDHIVGIPEILNNMLTVLDKKNVISEYIKRASPYIISFSVPITEITFDEYGNDRLNNKQKKYLLLRYCLYYLSMKKLSEWSEHDNPIIRLKDNLNIDRADVLGIYMLDKKGELIKLR